MWDIIAFVLGSDYKPKVTLGQTVWVIDDADAKPAIFEGKAMARKKGNENGPFWDVEFAGFANRTKYPLWSIFTSKSDANLVLTEQIEV